MHADVVVIGAGLAGLSCARELARAGFGVMLLEASDGVGGRVRTDVVEGYRLDRGFQVFLSSYPEASRHLDYKELDLRFFEPGAMVFAGGVMHTLMDPWQRPGSVFDAALSKVGTLMDKVRVGSMRSELRKASLESIYAKPEQTIGNYLKGRGFSEQMINRFFRPFFGGITFDPSLESSSRFMEFVFQCFSRGGVGVPRFGMQRISDQLHAQLSEVQVRLNTEVERISGYSVHTSSGSFTANAVVVACGGSAAERLLERTRKRAMRSVTCLYYAIEEPNIGNDKAILHLDGDGSGPIINAAVMSNVSPSYAPPGKGLASLTMVGMPTMPAAALQSKVVDQMSKWFGAQVRQTWRHLRTYSIKEALPDQRPPWMMAQGFDHRVRSGSGATVPLFHCGDETDTASIDGAMLSGRRCAEQLIAALKVGT